MNDDIGETFKDLRQASQNKREHNRRYSTKLLSSKRVKFKVVNNGYHLIIEELSEHPIDFWPSTGLWKVRSTNEKNRGIKSLLEYLEAHGPSSTDRQK
jgi:hypothetical protein